jgi:predicted DsbA family dithiol-disulfide isomerase
MARAAFQIALVSPKVRAEVIEINEFPELAQRYSVRAVPLTVINDRFAIPGMVEERVLVDQITKVAEVGEPGGEAPTKPIERGKVRDSGLYIP